MTGEASLTGLGTLLRHVLDEMDADIASVLADLGTPGYRPRYSAIVRALVALGPVPIRDLARATAVTQSAASQTITQMASRGFVVLKPGEDARQRVVHLTAKTRALLPKIEAEWAATASAAAEMDAELPFPLAEMVPAIAAALARRPFRERIISSAWAQANPDFTAKLAAARRARSGLPVISAMPWPEASKSSGNLLIPSPPAVSGAHEVEPLVRRTAHGSSRGTLIREDSSAGTVLSGGLGGWYP